MCDFNNLSTSEYGFILRCKSCGHYQIGFGTTIFSLNKTDFEKFSLMITDLSQQNFQDRKAGSRQLVLPTPYYGVSLLLSPEEILQVQNLIKEAEQEETMQSMLALFSDN